MNAIKPKLFHGDDEKRIRKIPNESLDVVIINTRFDILAKESPTPAETYTLTANSRFLLEESIRVLKTGGLLFVYGLPKDLPFLGEFLTQHHSETGQMIFKYWIALDIDARARKETLQPAHMGLLLYLKSASLKAPSPFQLNTKEVRVPHKLCNACGLNVKDWGGKKHLMHPAGTALSDVWRDLPKKVLKDDCLPRSVEQRIIALTQFEGAKFAKLVQKSSCVEKETTAREFASIKKPRSQSEWGTLNRIEKNRVYGGDCVGFLQQVAKLHPGGLFDMAFADPPYNLSKGYSSYDDTLADQHYIDWCNEWLYWMARNLKPGGSLLVLNLPKWAIHHATFLQAQLDFRHWIVWDALSDPRGKIMPAHYALLHYTKPGALPVCNYSGVSALSKMSENVVAPPDSPKYCLRGSCVKRRKHLGDDERVELSDIWSDVHRIKHKRDRDAHPCQLPEKLMERIIKLTTPRGGLVFDPFCGAGTTVIASLKLRRSFVTTELDKHYVEITERKIAAMQANADLFGYFSVPRQRVEREKKPVSKKEIETYLQNLAVRLGKEPTDSDIHSDRPEMLANIDLIYPSRLEAIKRCRVALAF
ncbi:MAG TPA: DNA methyltransferase [Verrucomicrobiae bacterium]|nr:DNA methyltransferase [Verrucomicrobiae bacterium]